ncbi:hypothetical protein H2203_008348 [Taxawa tesnikishii (nom. ined.)]|nr:hypothetical protein H2203_008348 [Dothideales sp. JES 119]
MLACSTIFVFFRMVSRIGIVKRVYLDDYFIILAWFLMCGMTAAICYGAFRGLGKHDRNVPPSDDTPLKKAIYAFSVLYNPGLMAEKTSILVFYLTLSKTNRTFRWATIATLVVVNAAGLGLTILNTVQCQPVSAAWESDFLYQPNYGKCIDIVTIYLSSSPVNIITDLAILFLPMPILTGMRLPKKQKTILVITFGFGIFAAAVDVVRIAYLQNASSIRLREMQNNEDDSTQDYGSTDFPYYAALSFMWSAIEVNVGIMCACVPALKPLVSRFMPHMLRDNPGDVTEKSTSIPSLTMNMARAHRIPSLPEYVHTRPPPATAQEESEEPMGMMDFLTTPDMAETDLRRTQTALTNSTRNTARPVTPTFFDFVNMNKKKSMVHMTTQESLFPIIMVTVLFFVWGFEYGLLDVLNQQFQRVANMTGGQTVAIHSAYFAGYAFGPITFGRSVLKRWGFKACYTVGLAIYACGTLIFWPAAVLTSFTAFIIVNFIVGMGLSTLEIAANPFIALCGPMEYAEIRLNLSQGFQAIGTVVAPLIAHKAMFQDNMSAPSLVDTQWAYLGIAFFTVFLAVAYYYVPLPEATDAELEDACERPDGANKAQTHGISVIWITLAVACFSQAMYMGGQEVVATTSRSYVAYVAPSLDTVNYTAVAHATAHAPGLYYAGAVAFAAASMCYSGTTAVALILTLYFFEGPIFSLVFAQALRGMGRHTKDASVLLVVSIAGAAVFPPLSYTASLSHHVPYSMCVAVAAFAAGLVLPVWVSANGSARRLADPATEKVVLEGWEE